jgi:hypothetical protein
MARKMIDVEVAPAGMQDTSGERKSRLSSAIMRILASARGATEGRRAVRPADLAPPRSTEDASAQRDEESGDAASRVEWTLRMMQ